MLTNMYCQCCCRRQKATQKYRETRSGHPFRKVRKMRAQKHLEHVYKDVLKTFQKWLGGPTAKKRRRNGKETDRRPEKKRVENEVPKCKKNAPKKN